MLAESLRSLFRFRVTFIGGDEYRVRIGLAWVLLAFVLVVAAVFWLWRHAGVPTVKEVVRGASA